MPTLLCSKSRYDLQQSEGNWPLLLSPALRTGVAAEAKGGKDGGKARIPLCRSQEEPVLAPGGACIRIYTNIIYTYICLFINMYACVYMYIYMHIHTCIIVYIGTHVHLSCANSINAYGYMCVSIPAYMSIYGYTFRCLIHVCIFMYSHIL